MFRLEKRISLRDVVKEKGAKKKELSLKWNLSNIFSMQYLKDLYLCYTNVPYAVKNALKN